MSTSDALLASIFILLGSLSAVLTLDVIARIRRRRDARNLMRQLRDK